MYTLEKESSMEEKSDSQTTVSELQAKVQEFCEARGWDPYHGPKDLAIGLITEASELLEHFRFRTEIQSAEDLADPKKREEICDELSDSLFFILRFSQKFGIDLSTSLKNKMIKSAKKYPVP